MDNNCVNIMKIQFDSKELKPVHVFGVCVHCDLGDMTLRQAMTHP